MNHMGVSVGSQHHCTQWITEKTVESGRDDDEMRVEFGGEWKEYVEKNGEIIRVPASGFVERHVGCVSKARASSNVVEVGFGEMRPEETVFMAMD